MNARDLEAYGDVEINGELVTAYPAPLGLDARRQLSSLHKETTR